MSLQFVFTPPKSIQFVQWQKVKFISSTPTLFFVKTTDKSTDRKRSRPLTLKSQSANGWYELLQHVGNKDKFPEIYDLSVKDPKIQTELISALGGYVDIKTIKEGIGNGTYETPEVIKAELDKYLLTITQQNGGPYIMMKEQALQAKTIFDQAWSSAHSIKSNSDRVLIEQLRDFASIKVSEHEQKVTTSFDAEKITTFLNALDQKQKMKAEWIIRMYCNQIPYRMRSIDISKLPFGAIDTLVRNFNIKL